MNKLKTGECYETHYQKSAFVISVIIDTEYTNNNVDWYDHENPYPFINR